MILKFRAFFFGCVCFFGGGGGGGVGLGSFYFCLLNSVSVVLVVNGGAQIL